MQEINWNLVEGAVAWCPKTHVFFTEVNRTNGFAVAVVAGEHRDVHLKEEALNALIFKKVRNVEEGVAEQSVVTEFCKNIVSKEAFDEAVSDIPNVGDVVSIAIPNNFSIQFAPNQEVTDFTKDSEGNIVTVYTKDVDGDSGNLNLNESGAKLFIQPVKHILPEQIKQAVSDNPQVAAFAAPGEDRMEALIEGLAKNGMPEELVDRLKEAVGEVKGESEDADSKFVDPSDQYLGFDVDEELLYVDRPQSATCCGTGDCGTIKDISIAIAAVLGQPDEEDMVLARVVGQAIVNRMRAGKVEGVVYTPNPNTNTSVH